MRIISGEAEAGRISRKASNARGVPQGENDFAAFASWRLCAKSSSAMILLFDDHRRKVFS
jgi:hypothetical protein